MALMRFIVASRDQVVVRMWPPRNGMVSQADASGVDVWCICPARVYVSLLRVSGAPLFDVETRAVS